MDQNPPMENDLSGGSEDPRSGGSSRTGSSPWPRGFSQPELPLAEPPDGANRDEPGWPGETEESEWPWGLATPHEPAWPEDPARETEGPAKGEGFRGPAEPTVTGGPAEQKPTGATEPSRSTEPIGATEMVGPSDTTGPTGPARPRQVTRPQGRPAGPLPPATYWRRRVIALCLGMCLLAVLVWAVNGTLSVPAPGSAASMASRGASAGSGSGAAKAQDAGTASAVRGSSGGVGGAGRWQALASPSAGPGRPGVSGSLAAAPRRGGVTARALPDCSRRAVVVSLLTRRRWYGPARRPEFLAEAVSTSRQPCHFNLGTRFMSIVVSVGSTKIWSSADCGNQPKSRLVVLTRGVPAAIWASWDRNSTARGCRARHRRVDPGTYTATAVAPHAHTAQIVFVLSGPRVAAPLPARTGDIT
jgi:hypothetical protein